MTHFMPPQFTAALPEIFVLLMIVVIMMADLFFGEKRRLIAYGLTQLTLVVAFALTFQQLSLGTLTTFNGLYIVDPLAIIGKLFILALSVFVFVYSRDYIPTHHMPRGEFHLLGLFSILGMMVLVSSASFLSLYLGLELLSLPLYAMVALKRDAAISSEAAMKYFVMGALASGMLLYGISMLYGAADSLSFVTVAQVIHQTSDAHRLILIFGLIFVIAGTLFKLGAAPFHMWVPDVYEGAPTAITLFITTAPKIAGLIMLLRLLVDAMPGLVLQWQPILIAIAVLSITLGNFIAITQSNTKRMFAYSSIAHMGYLLLGVIAATPLGYSASLFYIFSYAIMAAGAFGLLTLLSHAGCEVENISDLQGLNTRNPWLALMMLIILFSMAGIPPTLGFFAKLGVLEALVKVHFVALAVYAIVLALVGAYYYLRVVKVMYFDEPHDATPIASTMDRNVAISINGLAIVALGIFPNALIMLCRSVF